MPEKWQRLRFTVAQGDIREARCDLVALKYAQRLYGADLAVVQALVEAGALQDPDEIRPRQGDVRLVETHGAIAAPRAVFIGTPGLEAIGYEDLRTFARTAVSAAELVSASHLALTIHGPGFGLDDVEAFLAEFAGCNEGVWDTALNRAASVSQVTFVEISARRAERLFDALEAALADNSDWVPVTPGAMELSIPPRHDRDARIANLPGAASETKKHAFVAMPFTVEHEDTYYYGIQRPVRHKGFVCERVDQQHFTGDVLARVKKKIEEAAVVIGCLADANPNVFLEIGYAWGKGRPTVLVTPSSEVEDLKFDVQGQRCLTYKSIRELENALGAELQGLLDVGEI